MKLVLNNEIIYDKPISTNLCGRRCDHIILDEEDFFRLAELGKSQAGKDQLVGVMEYMQLKFRPKPMAPDLPLKRSDKLKYNKPT